MSIKNVAQLSLACLIIGFAWLGVLSPAEAQTQNQILQRVQFEQVDVREALRQIFKQVNASYSIAPEVQATVTVDLKNVSFEVALQNILRQASATYRIEGGVYEIVSRPTESVEMPSGQNQIGAADAFDFNGSDVTEALRGLFKVSGRYYSIAPEVQGRVTLSVRNEPYDTILMQILRQVHATYHIEGDVYMITPVDQAPRFIKTSSDSGEALVQPESRKGDPAITQDGKFLYIIRGTTIYKVQKSDLKLVKTSSLGVIDVRDALEELFETVQVSFTIAPDVRGFVTPARKIIPFDSSLQNILRQVDATYRIEAGVYEIIHRQDSIAPNPTTRKR